MKQKDVLKKRKSRKDELKKRKNRKKYEVTVRYVSSRKFTVMAKNEREAVMKAINNLYLLEPINTNTVSAVTRHRHGSNVYDHHFDTRDLGSLEFDDE